MAENRIGFEDFIDPKLISELDKLEKKLQDLDKTLTHMKEGQGEFVDPKGFSEYQKELEKLNQKIKEAEGLEKERLRIEQQRVNVMTKLEAAEQGYTKELEIQKQKLNERNKAIREEIKNGKMAADSIKALREENKRLRQEMDLVSTSTKEGREQLAKYKQQIDRNTEAIRKATDSDRQRISGIGKYKEAFQGAIATATGWAAAIYSVYQALSSVIETRAQFEKFEAVLTNALGSKTEAVKGMQMIAEFASKTPFQIEELTNSYVKLVNRGFKPTVDEMEKLGDLASSTGKSFDQLVEAILDAQTGEFERLKEFGITSKKQGENVTFTFKGVQTQVEATDEQIKKYILSLGELNGVSGSMAVISETLGGKISNLGDKWTQLLNTTGKESEGLFTKFIDGLSYVLDFAEKMISSGKITTIIKTIIFGPLYLAYEGISKLIEKTKNQLQEWGWIDKKTEEIKKTDELIKAENELFQAKYRNSQIAKDASDAASQIFDKYKKQEQEKGFFEQDHIVKSKEEIEREKEKAKEKEKIAKEAEEEKTKELKKGYDDYMNTLQKSRKADIIKQTETIETNKQTVEQVSKDSIEALQQTNDRRNEINENQKEIDKQDEETKKELRQQTFDETVAFANALFDLGNARREQEMTDLENKRQYELELAGDNEKKKAEINKKYDREAAKIKTEQAKADRNQALFNIAIQTGVNIVKAFPNPYLIALAAALGIAQAATVSAKKIPKFKKGVIDFKGEGTETSDSNIVAISKGESVIKAASTKKAKNLLSAINSDGSKEQLIKAFLTDVGGLGGTIENQKINYNEKFDKLIKQNEKLISVLSSKNSDNFDSWKVGKMIEKNQQRIIEKNKYLK